MPKFDSDLLAELQRLPSPLLEDVIKGLGEYYRSDEPGATMMIQRAGGDDHHVRVFDGPDTYRHTKGEHRSR